MALAKSLNVNVEKCAERLKDRFPQFEEYKLDCELPASKGKYIAMKIQNENPVSFPIYAIISQYDGIMLRFGDMVLYVNYPEVDQEMLERVDQILSDKLVMLVNYQNNIYVKSGIPKFSTYFIINDSGEFDEDRIRLRDALIDLRHNLTGIKRLMSKYKGITVIVNWSGSTFEKFER